VGDAVGVMEHESLLGVVRHAYRIDDQAHTLCGRRAFAGTSRGNVWRDLGELAGSPAVTCLACQEGLKRLGVLPRSEPG
jgi:hypothetical protein